MKKLLTALLASSLLLIPFIAFGAITTVPWRYDTVNNTEYPYPSASVNIGIGTTTPKAVFVIASSTLTATGTLFQIGNDGRIYSYSPYVVFGDVPPTATGPSVMQETWSNKPTGMDVGMGNISSSTAAFDEFFFNNDLSDPGLTHYAVIGQNSSKYNDTTFGTFSNQPNAFYLDNTDGNISLNTVTTTPAGYIAFGTGGNQSSNERMRILNTGNIGIGTTSPYAKLSVHAKAGETNTTLFSVGSSTASATTTLLTVANTGNVGVQTVGQTQALSVTDNNGNDAQISLFGAPSKKAYYRANSGFGPRATFGTDNLGGFFYMETANPFYIHTGADFHIEDNNGLRSFYLVGSGNHNLGIGSTSPYAKLSVHAASTDTNTTLFSVASSTASATTTLFSVGNTGEVTVGGATPTISACGTTPNGSVVGNDSAGKVSIGGGVVTACTVTFATPKKGIPHVFIQVEGVTAIASSISGLSSTGFTANFASTLGSGAFHYNVISN